MGLTVAFMHAGEGAQITHPHSHAALQYLTALHFEHLFSAPTLPHEAQAGLLCAVHAPKQGGIVSRDGNSKGCTAWALPQLTIWLAWTLLAGGAAKGTAGWVVPRRSDRGCTRFMRYCWIQSVLE